MKKTLNFFCIQTKKKKGSKKNHPKSGKKFIKKIEKKTSRGACR